MECVEIKAHLSAYVDGFLDPETKRLVEKHVSTCEACSKSLESLQSLVRDLRNLEQVKAPDDFLERVHHRMTKGLVFRKLKKVALPLHTKILYPFATAAAMAVLIFFIIHTPEMKKEMVGEKHAEAPEFGAKVFLQENSQFKEEEKPSVKKSVEEIELHLILPPEALWDHESPEPDHEADILSEPKKSRLKALAYSDSRTAIPAPPRTTKQGRSITERTNGRHNGVAEKKAEEADTGRHGFIYLRDMIERLHGEVLSTQYDRNTGYPKTLEAEIPSDQYSLFCEELHKLGTLQSSLPDIETKKTERIRILIHLIRS